MLGYRAGPLWDTRGCQFIHGPIAVLNSSVGLVRCPLAVSRGNLRERGRVLQLPVVPHVLGVAVRDPRLLENPEPAVLAMLFPSIDLVSWLAVSHWELRVRGRLPVPDVHDVLGIAVPDHCVFGNPKSAV